MARIGKALGGLAVAIGLPVLVVGQWQQEVRDNPVRAALLVLAWELIVAIGYLAAKIVALPASRRLEQVGDAVDLALGRRVSRYGRRYRQWVVDSKRFM